MAGIKQHSAVGVWELAARQHGVVARRQLRDLGFSDKAIDHRVGRGRLHLVEREVLPPSKLMTAPETRPSRRRG
jgi:hypothetical protein